MKTSLEIMQEVLDTEVGDQGDVNACTLYKVRMTDIQKCVQEAQKDCNEEIARITQLLKQELLNDRDWSPSLKEETWIEYCKAHKIEQ